MLSRTKLCRLASRHEFIALMCLVAISCSPREQQAPKAKSRTYLIGVTQFVSHPSLDSVHSGILEGLADLKTNGTVKFVYRNAEGDFTLASKIASDFRAQGVDVYVPISTPSAQAIAQAVHDRPIVFSGVTDPIGAGLVTSLEKPGRNLTGITDRWPFEEQFQLFKEIMPTAKNVGYIYNPGEGQANFSLIQARTAASRHGLTLVESQISEAAQIRSAALQLGPRVDFFYVGVDNTVVAGLESLLKAGQELRIPVFAGDLDSVKRGALATIGVGFRELGIATADMIREVILQNGIPGEMPVRSVDRNKKLYYNSHSFSNFGMPLPRRAAEAGQDLASNQKQ